MATQLEPGKPLQIEAPRGSVRVSANCLGFRSERARVQGGRGLTYNWEYYLWRVRIAYHCGGDTRAQVFEYRVGSGCADGDKFIYWGEFIDSLHSDYNAGCDYSDCTEFAREFGYDESDGRKVFDKLKKQNRKLQKIFGLRTRKFLESQLSAQPE